MTSRRLRKRGEKRDRYADPSPELLNALDAIEKAEPSQARESESMVLKDGNKIDLRKRWTMPGVVR